MLSTARQQERELLKVRILRERFISDVARQCTTTQEREREGDLTGGSVMRECKIVV